MAAPPLSDGVARWEASIGSTDARPARAHFLDGVVHVLSGVEGPPEEVATGGLWAHQIFVLTQPLSWVRERIVGAPPHLHGPQPPGVLFVASAEVNADDIRTAWRGAASAVNICIAPRLVQRLCATHDLDPDRVEITSQFGLHEPDPLLDQLARALALEAEQQRDGLGQLYAESLLHTIALHLVTHYATHPLTLAPRGGLATWRHQRVEAYVRAHLAEALSLDTLARVAGLSTTHFATAFRTTTGEPVFAFVRRLRMERAGRYLQAHPVASVQEAALEVGYESRTSFTRAFRAHWGASPGAYRRAFHKR